MWNGCVRYERALRSGVITVFEYARLFSKYKNSQVFKKSFSWNTDFNFNLQAKKPNKKPEFLGVHSIHSGEKDPRALEVWWRCNALVSVGVLVWPWNGWIPSALLWAPKWPSIALHQRRGRFPGPTKNPWGKWSPKREPKLNHVFCREKSGWLVRWDLNWNFNSSPENGLLEKRMHTFFCKKGVVIHRVLKSQQSLL